VQTDIHDWLALPVGGPTLDRTEWVKDPGLEPGFNLVLDRIPPGREQPDLADGAA
jgi:hypothetical protein